MNDLFRGDTASLVGSIQALLDMDAIGSLKPHGLGGHARTLLTAAAARLTPSIEESATFTPWDSLPWKPKPIGFAQRSDIELYAKVLTIRPPDAMHDVALFTRDQLQRAVSAALKEFEGMHWVDLDKALAAPAGAGVEEFPLPEPTEECAENCGALGCDPGCVKARTEGKADRGIVDSRCNYLALKDSICNKCGREHDGVLPVVNFPGTDGSGT